MYFSPIYPGLFNFINKFLHAAAEAGADAEMQQMFISYRGYCARKGVSANRIYNCPNIYTTILSDTCFFFHY